MAKQYRLGEFWLAWRTDRKEWAICWNDRAAGTRRRKSTGERDFNDGEAPPAAQQALADHFARHGQPEAIDPDAKASVSRVMTAWLAKEGINRTRAPQYGFALGHLQRWFDREGGLRVADISVARTKRYIDMRLAEGVKGETIHGELAALKTALRWAADNDVITHAPTVAKVAQSDRSGPREIEFSKEQVAAILDATVGRPERAHVHLFTMIMLSTHARVEAVMELDAAQCKGGRINFLASGRAQTSKRRSIVPIAPSLAPWLPAKGKVIRYTAIRKDGTEYERPTYSIRTAFAHTLIDAGLYAVEADAEGEEVKVPWGYPNALRHTCHTYMQTAGVPQGQIDAAAGHSEPGSGRAYSHLRPEYLREFIAAVESYWSDLDKLTTAHRRSQLGPNEG